MNIGPSRIGGIHSMPNSPGTSSPGHNTGCINLKWNDIAGKSKFKAGEYSSATRQIAPETLTPGKNSTGLQLETPTYLTPKAFEREQAGSGGEQGRKPQQSGNGTTVPTNRQAE